VGWVCSVGTATLITETIKTGARRPPEPTSAKADAACALPAALDAEISRFRPLI
jgi:hypothetical protein